MITPLRFLLILLLGMGQVELKPFQNGPLEARLIVKVSEEQKTQGLAELSCTLTITGPKGLEVQPALVEDAASSWSVQSGINEKLEGDTVRHTETLDIQQIKPGNQQVPTISVRMRPNSGSDWERAEWTDILSQIDPPLEFTIPKESQPFPWILIPQLLCLLLLLSLPWLLLRKKKPAVLHPARQAFEDLALLEKETNPDSHHNYHSSLMDIIRAFLNRQCHLEAEGKTTIELLETIQRQKEFRNGKLLGEIMDRCDRAKFAQSTATPADNRETTEMARRWIREWID